MSEVVKTLKTLNKLNEKNYCPAWFYCLVKGRDGTAADSSSADFLIVFWSEALKSTSFIFLVGLLLKFPKGKSLTVFSNF